MNIIWMSLLRLQLSVHSILYPKNARKVSIYFFVLSERVLFSVVVLILLTQKRFVMLVK